MHTRLLTVTENWPDLVTSKYWKITAKCRGHRVNFISKLRAKHYRTVYGQCIVAMALVDCQSLVVNESIPSEIVCVNSTSFQVSNNASGVGNRSSLFRYVCIKLFSRVPAYERFLIPHTVGVLKPARDIPRISRRLFSR